MRELQRGLQVAHREGWHDNLAGTVFHMSHVDAGGEEEAAVEEEFAERLAELEGTVEEETEKAVQSGEHGSTVR